MNVVARIFLAVCLASAAAGCCAGPYRFYQNAYGFNNPRIDRYARGPRPPVTTPPGMTTKAVQPPPPSVRQQ